MTKDFLLNFVWTDFAIMSYEDTQVLVLLYDNPSIARQFLSILHDNEFDISVNTENERYYIKIKFIKFDLGLKIVTNKTEETHKIEKYLYDDISYISTGILDKAKLPTRYVLFDQRLKSIKFDLDTFLNNPH